MYPFRELVNIERLNNLFQKLSKINKIGIFLLEIPSQEILISSEWKDICQKFHRAYPESAQECSLCDKYLSNSYIDPDETRIIICKNGLVHGYTPIIIDEKHLATLFVGQVLFNPPDVEMFKKQGIQYGYDIESYLETLKDLPVISEENFKDLLNYFSEIAKMIAETGRTNKNLKNLNKEQENLFQQRNEELQKYSHYVRSLIEASLDPLVAISPEGKITDVNEATINVTGTSREELIGTDFSNYFADPEKAKEGYKQVLSKGFVKDYPLAIRNKSGQITDVLYNASLYKDIDGHTIGIFAAARDITERKEAEENLQKYSHYVRSLIEASLDPLVAISPEGKITDVNEATIDVTGTSREELIGTDFSNYFADPEKAREGYKQVLSKGFVKDYPLAIRNKSGQITDVLYNASLYKDIDGHTIGIFAAARDITERKKVEEDLQKSSEYINSLLKELQEEKDNLEIKVNDRTKLLNQSLQKLEEANLTFKAISDSTAVAIIMINSKGKVTYWSDAAEKLFGYSCDEVLNQDLHLLVAPKKYYEAYSMGIKEFQTSGTGANIGKILELDAIRKDGREFVIELSLSSIKIQDEWHAVGMVKDITEFKRDREVVKAINTLYYETLNSETIEEVAKACLILAQTLTGSKYGFIGEISEKGTFNTTGLSEVSWETCQIPTIEALKLVQNMEIKGIWGKVIKEGKTLRTNNPSSISESTGTPKGHPFISSFLGVPFIVNDKVTGMIALANKEKGFDENDQIALESLILTFSSVISRKRKDEEIKLQKEKLEEINIKLEKANKQRSLFLSSLSHELRTPLNAIIGFADLLEDQVSGPLNEKQIDYIQLICKNSLHLSGLIGDLLDITRIDAGKISLEMKPGYATTLIDEVISTLEHKRAEKGHKITHISSQSPKNILIDNKRFKQIIFNLLSNAINYTPDEGEITIIHQFTENNYLKVSVIDNGIGIPPEDIVDLFKDFHQIERKRTKKSSGLGIGLPLTKRIVDLFDGTISVESTPDKGSNFTFVIPVKMVTEYYDNKADIPEDKVISMPKGKKILVVEDNITNMILIREQLLRYEHRLTFAKNGLEAIEAIKNDLPDLVLMDIKMPVMDGMEAIKILRGMPEFNNLPIIALTAITGHEAIKEQLDAGFNRHISKPIKSTELYNVLSEFLS